jgi:hypothetical protein
MSKGLVTMTRCNESSHDKINVDSIGLAVVGNAEFGRVRDRVLAAVGAGKRTAFNALTQERGSIRANHAFLLGGERCWDRVIAGQVRALNIRVKIER